ncbi:MAG: STAS-like domain-containing protein [Flavobacteriaceae bacterium]|nr:STAS-like domain-containing protein [Flavobacteriaceae bacterium]
MVIYVKDIVLSCDTNSQGDELYAKIQNKLCDRKRVVVDFSGINNVTTSFINSSLVALIESYDLVTIKNRVIIKKVNRQIGNLIRDRFSSPSISA